MISRDPRRVLLLTLVLAAVAPSAAEPPLRLGLVERSQVAVVQDWPFVVRPRKPAHAEACGRLEADGLRVLEGGQPVRVLGVTRAAPLTTHALLLDTSASMSDPNRAVTRKRARQTRIAARAYVRWMLADHEPERAARLMIATFDDDLILRAPRTVVDDRTVVAALDAVIGDISGGYYTALYDSVYRLTDYLGGFSERAVILLLSDGGDRSSLRDLEDVTDLVVRTNNVTVFAIAIGAMHDAHRRFLETIAASSGGRTYWIRGRRPRDLGAPLEKRFGDIRDRLRSQFYVSWAAEPHGALEGDVHAVDAYGNVRRSVRIESLDRRCEIPADGYRPIRTVAAPRRPRDAVPARRERDDPAGDPREPGSAAAGLALVDIVSDGNPLIRYGFEPGRASWEERRPELIVPPFAEALGDRAAGRRGPEDIVHDWLLGGLIPERTEAGRAPTEREAYFPVRHEINGSSFLDGREAIAAAILSGRPSYRRWARERLAQRVRESLAPRGPEPSTPRERAELEAVLSVVVDERLSQAVPGDHRNDLADWLGDVPARGLAFALERKQANMLLSGEPDAVAEVATVQRRWLRLHDWLYFPDRVRVTTPLELVCDRARQACGFYRIVLPRVGELPEDLDRPTGKLLAPETPEQWNELESAKIPRHPFGLLLIRALLRASPPAGRGAAATRDPPDVGVAGVSAAAATAVDTRVAPATGAAAGATRAGPGTGIGTLAAELRTRWRVETLEHRAVDLRSPRRKDAPAAGRMPDCRRRVRLGLRPHPDGDAATTQGPPLMLEVVVDGFREEPARDSSDDDRLRGSCDDDPAPVDVVPRCWTLAAGERRARLAAALRAAGLVECRGAPRPSTGSLQR